MSTRTRQFLAIFFFIGAVVGVGLAVVNGSQKPPATGTAFLFGVIGVIMLIGGVLTIRRQTD